MTTISPRWDSLPCDDDAAARLAAALSVPPIVARLLCQRGLGDPDLAARFLHPSLEHLHDPLMLADMGVAVDRIMAAIARQERIAIHGDYDVDGITSTVILRRALELLGAQVVHFIPERLRDGYGLQPAAIERLHAEGVSLVVSVDCGIRGADAALCDQARDQVGRPEGECGLDRLRRLSRRQPVPRGDSSTGEPAAAFLDPQHRGRGRGPHAIFDPIKRALATTMHGRMTERV